MVWNLKFFLCKYSKQVEALVEHNLFGSLPQLENVPCSMLESYLLSLYKGGITIDLSC